MAGSWTSERFPKFKDSIQSLTEQHRELEDEPLRLAISYGPATREPQDIYLFEVIDAPWAGTNPERDLFEVTFGTSPGFPLRPDQRLHLILTNPPELEAALRERWPLMMEVINAIRDGDCEVLFKDDVGERLLTTLRAEAVRGVAAHG